MINWPFFTISTLIQTLLAIIFITIFFFTYVSTVEKRIVIKQVENLVDDINKDTALFLNEDEMKSLSDYARSVVIDTSQDGDVISHNKNIKASTVKSLSIAFASIAFILALACIFFKINLKELIGTGVVSIASIVLVEFIFTTFFVQGYQTLDENYVKLQFATTLQQYVSSN